MPEEKAKPGLFGWNTFVYGAVVSASRINKAKLAAHLKASFPRWMQWTFGPDENPSNEEIWAAAENSDPDGLIPFLAGLCNHPEINAFGGPELVDDDTGLGWDDYVVGVSSQLMFPWDRAGLLSWAALSSADVEDIVSRVFAPVLDEPLSFDVYHMSFVWENDDRDNPARSLQTAPDAPGDDELTRCPYCGQPLPEGHHSVPCDPSTTIWRAVTTPKESRNDAFDSVAVEGDLVLVGGRAYIHPRASLIRVDGEMGHGPFVLHEVVPSTARLVTTPSPIEMHGRMASWDEWRKTCKTQPGQ